MLGLVIYNWLAGTRLLCRQERRGERRRERERRWASQERGQWVAVGLRGRSALVCLVCNVEESVLGLVNLTEVWDAALRNRVSLSGGGSFRPLSVQLCTATWEIFPIATSSLMMPRSLGLRLGCSNWLARDDCMVRQGGLVH